MGCSAMTELRDPKSKGETVGPQTVGSQTVGPSAMSGLRDPKQVAQDYRFPDCKLPDCRTQCNEWIAKSKIGGARL